MFTSLEDAIAISNLKTLLTVSLTHWEYEIEIGDAIASKKYHKPTWVGARE